MKIIIVGCGTTGMITMEGYDSTRERDEEGSTGLPISINSSIF
jgi:hypothetical protein